MVTTTTAAEDSPTKTSATATPTITSAPSGNPFDGYDTYANDYYRSEIYNLAIPSLSPSLVAEAKEVAEVPSFVWL
jgi:cellulose 1,4-beta-cellobiosidase